MTMEKKTKRDITDGIKRYEREERLWEILDSDNKIIVYR